MMFRSSLKQRPLVHRAVVLSVAISALSLAAATPASAQIFDLARVVLNRPALISAQATAGLFTSVTRAGNRLVAVGQDGRIVLSDDNGKSWRQVEAPTSVTLTHDVFVSPTEGWATGQMGTVLRTMDAGEHWSMQFDGFRANQQILAAAQAEATQQPPPASAATDLVNAKQFISGGPSVPFLTLLPVSADNLVLGGGFGMAFTSTDGGATWRSIFSAVPNPNGLHIYDIIADGANQIWAGEEGFVLLRDASGSFKTLTTPFQGTFFGALKSKSGALILYGLQGTILRSTNDGTSWSQIAAPTQAGVDAGIILQNGDILLGDEDGSLLLSRDDGQTFTGSATGGAVVGLAQAADGSIITAGPRGMNVVALSTLGLSD